MYNWIYLHWTQLCMVIYIYILCLWPLFYVCALCYACGPYPMLVDLILCLCALYYACVFETMIVDLILCLCSLYYACGPYPMLVDLILCLCRGVPSPSSLCAAFLGGFWTAGDDSLKTGRKWTCVNSNRFPLLPSTLANLYKMPTECQNPTAITATCIHVPFMCSGTNRPDPVQSYMRYLSPSRPLYISVHIHIYICIHRRMIHKYIYIYIFIYIHTYIHISHTYIYT